MGEQSRPKQQLEPPGSQHRDGVSTQQNTRSLPWKHFNTDTVFGAALQPLLPSSERRIHSAAMWRDHEVSLQDKSFFFYGIKSLPFPRVPCFLVSCRAHNTEQRFNKLFLFSFDHTCGMRKFPGQRLNPCHRNNQSHSSDNAKSLTH